MKIDSLTTNEKVVLAQQLWDSVVANEDSLEVSANQKAELGRRVSEFESDGNTGNPWASVKTRILNK
ncbi:MULTISPECIES: addiction module protein [Alteromonadaceae]|jgi:putative addiction module component (TIGR02574 family)|uniref:Addiction module protein n=1 Tax=Brumicola blandensis TaxID=3075611 RepID=A0AAW8R0G2_9ALTE|nr:MULTISPECIES: addiction module protein [unclassified Alteromonas]MDT0581708.1 addiction module protein [Alteromonas sp. W409]MDT0630101.1 addiction module protein [Alteromonas sp. W364]